MALSYSKEVGKYHKGAPEYSKEIGKFLPEYLILQGRSDFVLSIKIQNTSIFQVKRHTFNKTINFASVLLLSTEHLFFLAEVVLFRASQIPMEKHISEYLFYKTVPSGCFCCKASNSFSSTFNSPTRKIFVTI